jgi:hypothetical protein
VALGRSKTETGLKFVVSEVGLEETTRSAVMANLFFLPPHFILIIIE